MPHCKLLRHNICAKRIAIAAHDTFQDIIPHNKLTTRPIYIRRIAPDITIKRDTHTPKGD
jgi:hypothetical protein